MTHARVRVTFLNFLPFFLYFRIYSFEAAGAVSFVDAGFYPAGIYFFLKLFFNCFLRLFPMFILGFSMVRRIKKRVISAFFAGSYLVISPIFSQGHPSIGLLYVHPPAFYAGLRRLLARDLIPHSRMVSGVLFCLLCGMLSRLLFSTAKIRRIFEICKFLDA
jgi:hypothetical protein